VVVLIDRREAMRAGTLQPPSSDLGCGDNHRAAEIARRDLGPTRGRSLSFRVAKRFYVREPFCPWVLSRIEPAAPPGELGQWIWWVIRLDLAGKERCCGEDPNELLRFLVRETMLAFQFGDADILVWASSTPMLDIMRD